VTESGNKPVAPPRLVARVGTLLAGWPGQWVERERMLQELWGDRPPRTALNTLQAHISQLRRAVGRDCVIGDSSGYQLDIDPTQVDAEMFEEVVHEASRAQRQLHLGRARQLLSEALDLWQGTPYRDIQDLDLLARRERLEELHRTAQENYLECQLLLARDSYQLDDAIACAKELVSLEPIRERRHILLVHALRHANRYAESAAAVDEAIQAIHSGTGVDLAEHFREAIEESARYLVPRSDVGLGRSNYEVNTESDGSIEGMLEEISEALVVQNVPILIACAPQGTHVDLAEVVAQHLLDDFPAGIAVVHGEHVAPNDHPPTQGQLQVLVGVHSKDIPELTSKAGHPDGALLMLTSQAPSQRIHFPVLIADAFEESPLRKTS